jgi:ZIP family zinc transporter
MIPLASSAPLPFDQTIALGAIAGLTIFIGLPVGRLRTLDPRVRVCLAMFSVGILAFIFMDVASHAEGILETHLQAYKDGHGSFGAVAGRFLIVAAGFTAGSAGLTMVDRWVRAQSRRAPGSVLPPLAGGSAEAAAVTPSQMLAPSQAATLEAEALAARQAAEQARRRALQTGLTVAFAIGLHNFAEGLAIGVSAATGAVGLATVLIIGFGAHNATEGFGIVGPLGETRPSWRWLVLAGLIAGAPTFFGTIVGYQVTSDPLELLFYALAAGALIYVIGEIWIAMRRFGHRELGLLMLSAGFLAGILTDLIVTYGGA